MHYAKVVVPVLAVLGVAVAAPASASTVARGGAEMAMENSLVFSRPDGSVVAFPTAVRVWCGRWERDVPVRSLHVEVGSRDDHEPFWSLRAVLADVRRRPVVRLPHSFVWNKPSGADLFAVDGTNELSSAEEEANGRIVFRKARCGRRLDVRFRVRGTLGSEFFDGPKLAVRGRFAARAS
jgi:hypothetical protein